MRFQIIAALGCTIGSLAGGVAAQEDLIFAMRATEACIAEGSGAACIGASADDCMMKNSDGDTTYGMRSCLGQEFQVWDDRLNAAYQQAMALAETADATAGDLIDVPSEVAALRAMQRAWIAYRDATCQYEELDMWGGTGQAVIAISCRLRLTGAQALYLESQRSY